MADMSASRLGKGSSPCLQALACKTFCPSCAGLISPANGFAESCPPDRSLAVTATSEWLARGAPMWGRIAQRKKKTRASENPAFFYPPICPMTAHVAPLFLGRIGARDFWRDLPRARPQPSTAETAPRPGQGPDAGRNGLSGGRCEEAKARRAFPWEGRW